MLSYDTCVRGVALKSQHAALTYGAGCHNIATGNE